MLLPPTASHRSLRVLGKATGPGRCMSASSPRERKQQYRRGQAGSQEPPSAGSGCAARDQRNPADCEERRCYVPQLGTASYGEQGHERPQAEQDGSEPGHRASSPGSSHHPRTLPEGPGEAQALRSEGPWGRGRTGPSRIARPPDLASGQRTRIPTGSSESSRAVQQLSTLARATSPFERRAVLGSTSRTAVDRRRPWQKSGGPLAFQSARRSSKRPLGRAVTPGGKRARCRDRHRDSEAVDRRGCGPARPPEADFRQPSQKQIWDPTHQTGSGSRHSNTHDFRLEACH